MPENDYTAALQLPDRAKRTKRILLFSLLVATALAELVTLSVLLLSPENIGLQQPLYKRKGIFLIPNCPKQMYLSDTLTLSLCNNNTLDLRHFFQGDHPDECNGVNLKLDEYLDLLPMSNEIELFFAEQKNVSSRTTA